MGLLVSLALILGVLAGTVLLYVQQPKFGRLPAGERLERIARSPNHGPEGFRNLQPTTVFTDGASLPSVIHKNMMLKRNERLRPVGRVPVVKIDLNALDRNTDLVVWLGHSSYFIQLHGLRIAIDPVLSRDAAPIPYVNRAFDGADAYRPEDLPPLDYLLLTHDHWDHLDHDTLTAIRERVSAVVCPLGVGEHLELWGYAKDIIRELDWMDEIRFPNGLTVAALPARHFSGRFLKRNQTLWVAFALISPERRIFASGDGGYGTHFAEIGRRFGGFDLALMENGQYDPRWTQVHMVPEELARAAVELGARAVLPGHAGKFAIANHAWDDPYDRIEKASAGAPYALVTPVIGEPVILDGSRRNWRRWWKEVDGGGS
jgi:L-ascorbate metabolism protein UlaG (beta-lactamase superfamily)